MIRCCVEMNASLLLPLLLTGLLLAPGAPLKAQGADPADGLELAPQGYRAVIGAPPAPGSRAEADDLAILRWNQRSRYPEAVEQSWRFLNRNLSSFDAAVGSDLSNTAPTLFKGLPFFLKRVDAIKNALKVEIARPRPYVSHPDLSPCLPTKTTFSYPSGHAAWYGTAALLLADLLPQRRERLLSVGSQGGFARSYCLVHYPSDVLASQRLSAAISRDVIASPQWQAFRQQLQGELGKLLVPPPAGLPLLSD
jgi:acid phosphatase (class A)